MSDETSTLPRLDLLRQMSDRVVFGDLVRGGPATRAELSVTAGLSKPTVSQAVRRLAEAGIVEVAGIRAGRRGGVGTVYRVSRTAGAVLAVSVDQSGISIRAVDLAGELVAEQALAPGSDEDEAALRVRLRHGVVRAKASLPGAAVIRSAVISVASPVNPRTNEVVSLPDSPFPAAVRRPAELLADLVEGPIRVDNDVNLAALAERHEGAAMRCDSFVYLYLGAGLGSAIYLANDLVRGAHGLAGEIGWLPTSATETRRSLARHYATGSGRGAPAVDVHASRCTLAGPDETARQALLAHLGQSAAHAGAALCATVDPELIVIGGPLGSIPAVAEAFAAALRSTWPQRVAVSVGALGEQAALLGATRVGLDDARNAALAAL